MSEEFTPPDLVSVVVSTHKKCEENGNHFDLERILENFSQEHHVNDDVTAVNNKNGEERSAETSQSFIRSPSTISMFDSSIHDMKMEVDNAENLLKSITNLSKCDEEKLKEMLLKTQEELSCKIAEVDKLSRLKETVSAELVELTSCLFEEANRMVSEANKGKYMAEQKAKQSSITIALLQEEIKMLKSITSHLPAPITSSNTSFAHSLPRSWNSRKQKRENIAKYNFENGTAAHRHEDNTRASSTDCQKTTQENKLLSLGVTPTNFSGTNCDMYAEFEKIDTKMFHEFLVWRENPILSCDSEFYTKLVNNDIEPCLGFCQNGLRKKLLTACENNLLVIENLAVKCGDDGSQVQLPKNMHCQLSNSVRICQFKVIFLESSNKSGDSAATAAVSSSKHEQCFTVCKMVRNRIAAVCELLTFLRYVSKNLYTSTQSIDLFVKLTELQRLCCMARLGFI